jgi:signal transduction histidine kinase
LAWADDRDPFDQSSAAAAGFKRYFLVPGAVLSLVEVALVLASLSRQFSLGGRILLLGGAVPLLLGAQAVWLVLLALWLRPLYRVTTQQRRGEPSDAALRERAYRATVAVPARALLARTLLWALVALAYGAFYLRHRDWQWRNVAELVAAAALNGFAVNLPRALWYARNLRRLRVRLVPDLPPLGQFAAAYLARLWLTALASFAGTGAAVGAFLFYFLPISRQQYVQIQTFFPVALAVSLLLWRLLARRLSAPVDRYIQAAAGTVAGEGATASAATTVYRLAQSLPYRLAVISLGSWVASGVGAAFIAREQLRFESDDAVLMLGVTLVIAVGGVLYEALWHRETMRPLLAHLTVLHRLPVRGIRTSLSLRVKLLVSFGGVVLFACGLALFWGFVQYKSLVTGFVARQADLGLNWLRSEVQSAVLARGEEPTPDLVRRVLRGINSRSPEANAVYYYLPEEPQPHVLALGGGPMGAPRLPWYALAQLVLPGEGRVEIASLSLSGRRGRLVVESRGNRHDLGSVAVFYPNYRGRGPSVVRPLKELLVFFLVLFGACAGIVLITVHQFSAPIRNIEIRADAMARGDLAEPVSSGAEGDEIGRLTFSLEEMRRALREKLRSTEESNLDLERAVQRRTADLAKKNRELAETLEKLTRAQDQLVRSEKMASIGQLVAGIAHEINNPVNAIVNTVGPLDEAIARTRSEAPEEREEAAEDVRAMLRVVQRGAERTKAIVQALHNYSRTDDESLVEVDINRSIDDSLELLRALLKQSIRVERAYGAVGRIRGHAGQLNQVFMNLLTNAAQALAGRHDAEIRIATRRDQEVVIIEIADNGPGIPEAVRSRIFDPFFTTKDVGEGTGLGLSIVHNIVERHGGSIEVDTAVGVGTTFRLCLPRDGGVPA